MSVCRLPEVKWLSRLQTNGLLRKMLLMMGMIAMTGTMRMMRMMRMMRLIGVVGVMEKIGTKETLTRANWAGTELSLAYLTSRSSP